MSPWHDLSQDSSTYIPETTVCGHEQEPAGTSCHWSSAVEEDCFFLADEHGNHFFTQDPSFGSDTLAACSSTSRTDNAIEPPSKWFNPALLSCEEKTETELFQMSCIDVCAISDNAFDLNINIPPANNEFSSGSLSTENFPTIEPDPVRSQPQSITHSVAPNPRSTQPDLRAEVKQASTSEDSFFTPPGTHVASPRVSVPNPVLNRPDQSDKMQLSPLKKPFGCSLCPQKFLDLGKLEYVYHGSFDVIHIQLTIF